MPSEVSALSLLHRLSETGFQASVAATYNCYFTFYEDVVLRRLMTAGCTHNILMVDATRCSEAFASDELRPRRAGRDYTLIPVKVGGAFHPKILLRLGKSKGSLLVGSHNMTLAGFGLNDEVTNHIAAEGSALRSAGSPFRIALDYLAGFVPTMLPALIEAYEGLSLGNPWLNGPLGAGDPSRILLTSAGHGQNLWSQVVPLVPVETTTAFVCGPFFDEGLAFIRTLLRDARPRELVVGIDPASVEVDPAEAASLPNVRWVNVAGIPQVRHKRTESSRYLHAKVLWFSGKNGELLVTGSANPSVAAFLAPADRRNAEAVLADSHPGAGEAIGIGALLGAPPVTAADWSALAERRRTVPSSAPEPGRHIWVAAPASLGFCSDAALPAGAVLHGIGDDGLRLGDAVVSSTDGTALEASELVRDGAHYLVQKTPDAELLVLIHRPEEIARNLGGDVRKALGKTIGALEEDPSQLETLLKLTDKVLFHSEDVVRVGLTRPAASGPPQPQAAAPAMKSLALDAAGKKSGRRRHSLAGHDVIYLLDALMHRLGVGLGSVSPSRERPDEAEIGADDELGGELAGDTPDLEALARACQTKVHHLVKRMMGQLELAKAPEQATRAVVQLAAVLAVLRALRLIAQRTEWRRSRLELVDLGDEADLFEAAVVALTWGADALAPRAIAAAGVDRFYELSLVVGLLTWLAWDTGVDFELASERAVGEEGRHGLQCLASLSTWLATDEEAIKWLEASVAKTPRFGGERWVLVHLQLVEQFSRVCAEPDRHGVPGRRPRPGDLVILSEQFEPRVRVAQDVIALPKGFKVTVFDSEAKLHQRTFVGTRVRSLAWPQNARGGAAVA